MIRGDNPIKRSEDDVLGRTVAASEFAQTVLDLDTSEGAVVGVLGPWGTGKTSFINLAKMDFEKANVTILDFNPWMFSGTSQLIEAFFAELSVQLKHRPSLVEVGEFLEEYGDLFSDLGWIPVVGTWFERIRVISKIAQKHRKARKGGVHEKRETLKKALSGLEKPILVVLDDIDRLSSSEIRDIFKLIRLTANFPNMIYIVAFDRSRIEKALDEHGIKGRDYLEKILQLAYDLPEVPDNSLTCQITGAVQDAIANIENANTIDEQVWPDVLMEIIRPLIHSMRDVRRYAASIQSTVRSLGGEVALVDLLALEAIRIFVPDVFERLHRSIEGLTGFHDPQKNTQMPRPENYHKKQVECVIKASEEHKQVVVSLITMIFPAGAHHIGGTSYGDEWKTAWLKDRRLAHVDILRLYLERAKNDSLQAFDEAERMVRHMADRAAFEKCLLSINPRQLQSVIASLDYFEEEFSPEYAVPGSVVLLNLLPLPERQLGTLDFPPTFAVTCVVLRLLKCLDDSASIENAIRLILPELRSLSSKLELISMVGYQDGVGHKLVIEKTALEFEKAWREEVRSSSVADLATEHNLLGVLLRTTRAAGPTECPLNIENSPEMTLAVLRAAKDEIIGQYLGSRAIQRKPRLHWKELIELYDDETTLRERVQCLKIANHEGSHELVALAEKYLGGYRDEGSR